MMDPNMTRRARAERKKKFKAAQRKLQPGWKPGRSKRRKQKAAVMIQRAYRSHLLRQAFQRSRQNVRFTFTSLRAFGHARSRHHWRNVDLRRLSREELRLLALTLNLPSTGKKVLLICRIQRWVDQHVLANDMAAQAAARALELRRKAQGSVYFCEAHPGADLVDIHPLRGHHITSIAAGSESDAVYALDGARGAAWLCRTGGLASQVGLCSHIHRRDEFESTPRESHWLATPVFLHTLRAEHVERVYVARGHAMVLAKAGELFSWGDNAHGALGFAAESAAHVARNRATVVGALSNYQAVAAAVGGHHSVAVCDHVAGHNGVVFCWGSNSHGQLGICPSKGNKITDRPAKSSPSTFPRPVVMHQVAVLRSASVRQVACGVLHSLALTSEGKVYSWGCSDGGRLGHGRVTRSNSDISEPSIVGGVLTNLISISIACGAWHSACIAAEPGSDTGRVFTWGTGVYGQLGKGKTLVTYEPQPVRLPPRELDDEVFATHLSCGTHHTVALAVDNRVFSWGSTRAFNGVPTELKLPGGEQFGRVASLACGRTFTVFNTVSRDAASYEWPEVPRLWRDKSVFIPRLDLSKVPPLPLCLSHPVPQFSNDSKTLKVSNQLPSPVRLEPFADRRAREEEEHREAKCVDDIDIEAIVHPLCRLCWRCNGFQPSPLRLWMCRNCSHERQLHGLRRPGVPMGEYEAVRKLQCLFRARRARRVLQRAREQRYQRIFSIAHNEFFYYNLWQGKKSWARPVEISEEFEVPIRDPDASPRISPPLTPVEAAVKLQAVWRGLQARRLMLKMLHDRYEKHFDLEKERVYHVKKPILHKKEQPTKLWEPPPLLRKRYDLGEPVEIQRLARFANMAPDEAAQIIQHAYRCHRGREFMRRILRSRIKKLWDSTTGRYFYYNTTTKESSWEKPRLLHDEDDDDELGSKVDRREKGTDKERRRHGVTLRPEKFHNEEAAARTIQALYRRFSTRKRLLELLSRRYRKIMESVSGQSYYYDSVAGTATWFKPAVFGAYDLEIFDDSTVSSSERRKSTLIPPSSSSSLSVVVQLPRISERARLKRHKRKLQRLRQMSRDEAASRLQRMWRTRRAKDELRELLFDAYEKIFDPTTEHFYYYNRKTGVAKWEKPVLLVGDGREIKETKIIKRRRSHVVTELTEAKQILFTFMRCAAARLELHRLLRERIQKVFDPNSQQYYYFDKLTGQSSWKKPVTLKEYDLSPV